MPWRMGPGRATIKFLTSARMPSLIYRAASATGVTSNTAYIQRALCEALSRDLGIPLEDLIAELPPTRNGEVFGGTRQAPLVASSANTVETVR